MNTTSVVRGGSSGGFAKEVPMSGSSLFHFSSATNLANSDSGTSSSKLLLLWKGHVCGCHLTVALKVKEDTAAAGGTSSNHGLSSLKKWEQSKEQKTESKKYP
jgi:hypothetical protein